MIRRLLVLLLLRLLLLQLMLKYRNKKKPQDSDSIRRKLTYKERLELQRIETEIAELEQQQKQIEDELCSGTLSVEDLTAKSILLPKLKAEIDDKSTRWLELSEIEEGS